MDERRRNFKCILCYKATTTTSVEETQTSNVTSKKFLLLLSRHLKIHSKLVSQVDVDIRNEFLCCEDCSKLGDSFSQLYFQFESIRLGLSWKITKIYETMLYAGRVPSRINAFRKQFEVSRNEELDCDHHQEEDAHQVFNEIEKLRKDLMKHLKRELKSSPPKVSLRRIDERGDKRVKTEKLSPIKGNPSGRGASTFNKFELLASLLTYIAGLHFSLPLLPSLIPIAYQKGCSIEQLDSTEENTVPIETETLAEEEESCRQSLEDDYDDSHCMDAGVTSPELDNNNTPSVCNDNVSSHSADSQFQEVEESLTFEDPALDDDHNHNNTEESYTQNPVLDKPSSLHHQNLKETETQNKPSGSSSSSSKSVTNILSGFTIRPPSPEKERSLLIFTRKSSRSLLNCGKCPKTFTNQASLDSHLKNHDVNHVRECDPDDENSNQDDMDVDLEPDMDSTSSSDSDNEMEIHESIDKVQNQSNPIETELQTTINIEEIPVNVIPKAEIIDPEIDAELKTRSCNQCPLIFDNIELLEQHYDSSHPDPSKYTSICPISGCASRFPTVRRLDLHLESHPKPQNLPPNQCELCLETFSCEPAVEKHRALHHNLDYYARCNTCGQMYASRFRLRFHRKKRIPNSHAVSNQRI